MKNFFLIGTNVIFLFLLSFIVPKNKNLFLFGDGHKNFMGNSRYLFEYLKNNNKKSVAYFVISKNSKYKEEKYKNSYIKNNSIKAFWLILRSKYIFVNGVSGDVSISHFLGRFNIINLWHGTPIKKIMFDDNKCFLNDPKTLKGKIMRLFSLIECKSFKLIVASNELTKKHLQSAFLNKNVEVLGYPRNDYFFKSNEKEKMKILKKLNLENPKKIFLYAPTFRDFENNLKPFSDEFLKSLNTYLTNNNYFFLINKHPFTKNILLKKFSNIFEISDKIEIQKILMISDIHIGDYSSIYFDFAIQNKVIISYLYDIEKYKKKARDLYFEIEKEMPSFKSYKERELLKLIKNIKNLEKNKTYKKKIIEFNNKFNTIEDGNSSNRILNFLIC